MQLDFHYCCIKVLAIMAGFGEKRAKRIADSSENVDEEYAHKGMEIDNIPEEFQNMAVNGRFEPICTAHKGINLLHSVERDVQRKIFTPFHFVPFEKFNELSLEPYSYLTKPNSEILKERIEIILARYEDETISEMENDISLGICVHALADTYAHEGFSCRWSNEDNDIEEIEIMQSDGKWMRINPFIQLFYNILPTITHIETYNLPDQSQLSWRYEKASAPGIQVERHNTEIFLNSAHKIYNLFQTITGEGSTWETFEHKIRACLSVNSDRVRDKWNMWVKTFPDINFSYDKYEWRKSALLGRTYNWEAYKTAKEYKRLKFICKNDIRWFLFHKVAKEHRKFVLDRINTTLL